MIEHNESPETPDSKTDDAVLSRTELRLKVHKLRLERAALKQQLSNCGRALEWLKAATTPVALLALIVTYIIGSKQISESQQTRENEHIEKALERLASEKEADRLLGVSTLRLFLNPTQRSYHSKALYFLVNTASLEKNTTVQNAILDAFRRLSDSKVDQSVLNATLEIAVDRNRSLTAKLSRANESMVREKHEKLLRQFFPNLDESKIQLGAGPLTDLQNKEIVSLYGLPFTNISEEEIRPLKSLSVIITRLVQAGANGQDFSNLYCEMCDFSRLRLDKASFSNSFLWGCNFAFSRLTNSNFERADIGGASFYYADLRNADLKGSTNDLDLDRTQIHNSSIQVPTLECADLRGTNLSNRVLVWLDDTQEDYPIDKHLIKLAIPNFNHVLVDSSTDIEPLGAAWSIDIGDKTSWQTGTNLINQTEAMFGNTYTSGRRYQGGNNQWKTRFTVFGGYSGPRNSDQAIS